MKILNQKRRLVDTDTGEEIEVLSIIPEVKDKNFTKVFKLMSSKVVKDLKAGLNGATDTLWWIIDNLQYNANEVYAHPKDIAKDLGMGLRTVERHLRLLKKYGYILQVDPRQHYYKVDPHMLFKGKVSRVYIEDER